MQELAVLLLGAVRLALDLQELEHERTARADVGAPGEEVAADEGLEDAGLAAALAADDGDLGELDRGLATELGEYVLKLACLSHVALTACPQITPKLFSCLHFLPHFFPSFFLIRVCRHNLPLRKLVQSFFNASLSGSRAPKLAFNSLA